MKYSKINLSSNQKLSICIAGKNNIAVNVLVLLFKGYKEYDIYCLPNSNDKGLDDWQPSLKRLSIDLKVKQATLEELYAIENLLFLSLEYSELIDTNKFMSNKLFNIHFSLLPKYKGMYTSTLPILHGEEYSGVTLHKIDKGIDTGEIIDQIKFKIEPDDTARDLYFKYLENGFILLKKNIDSLINDCYSSTPQTTSHSSYFSKKEIDYSDIKINLNKTAFEVQNQFRAFTFREYQMPTFQNWKIYKTELLSQRSDTKAGVIILENDIFLIISTIDYNIKLYKDYYEYLWNYCHNGDHSSLMQIINYIPDVNLLNSKNWNAIIIATYNGHLDIIKTLILFGANLNSTNQNGTTLLMYALSYFQHTRDSKIFKFLLESGCNLLLKDNYGKTLKDYIKIYKCEDLLKYLN